MESPPAYVLEKLFDHPDEVIEIIEAFELDNVEYLPYAVVIKLIEHKLYTP